MSSRMTDGIHRWSERVCQSTLGGCTVRQHPFTPHIAHSIAMAFINYITQIQIDFGAVSLLPHECERIGIRKPLVVSDAGVRAAGVLDKALAALGKLPHAVF